jgi:hypothetical protein
VSALAARSNPFLDALKGEVNKLIWQCFEDIKDDSVPIHITVFHVPVGINVKISNLQGIIEKLVGPEGSYDAVPVAPAT